MKKQLMTIGALCAATVAIYAAIASTYSTKPGISFR